jgi:hypothetical protein
MKTAIFIFRHKIMLAMVAISITFTGCSKETDEPVTANVTVDPETEALMNYENQVEYTDLTTLKLLATEELSAAEAEALTLMREEEFLAHDVYLAMSQLYNKPIFKNIRKSEAIHTEAIRLLLVKYKLPDPAANHVTGIFSNPDLQSLYTTLVTRGSQSLMDALQVGATIEDLDIYDLENHIAEVDNKDILFVFNNLMRGSENHLRAFYANIVFMGGTYSPQYISLTRFNAIIN